MISGHSYHDDIQGVLGTALVGVTAFTWRQYRNTGIPLPHIAQGDIFTMVYQFSHRKTLEENCDGVHIHYIPIAQVDGNIKINYTWGWYNPNDDSEIPDVLPNSGSVEWSLVQADQYKLKIKSLIDDMAYPTSEDYSSILFVRCVRVAPVGTNWGATNEFALVYKDAHMPVSRRGSYNEYTD